MPDVLLRADGLTSLRILDGLRTGALDAGIVRGPIARAWPAHVGTTGPGARRPRRRADGASPGGGRRRRSRRRCTPSRCSSSIGTTRRPHTTPSSPTAPRPGHGRVGSPTPPCRSSGCSIRSPWGRGSGGSTRGRPSRRRVDPTSRCGRCAQCRCTTSSAWCGGPTTRRTRRPVFVEMAQHGLRRLTPGRAVGGECLLHACRSDLSPHVGTRLVIRRWRRRRRRAGRGCAPRTRRRRARGRRPARSRPRPTRRRAPG